MDGPPYNLAIDAGERFEITLPSGAPWADTATRRAYSSAHMGRAACGEQITATLYPRTTDGGEYRDAAHFLRATGRIPADIVWHAGNAAPSIRQTIYTDGTTDRYYALLEAPAALLELDCLVPRGADPPPLAAMIASARITLPPREAAPAWETLALPAFRVEIPADWPRKDEHNRALDAAYVSDARGISVRRDDPPYSARQRSRPQYRIEQLASGKNLASYLVGLKTERRRTSIDGTLYEFSGEDRIRTRHVRGSRLRYQGYSPRGVRGSLEWYHELLLLEVGDATLLITAYCDWIERHRFAPVFARITKSLAPA